MKKYKKTGRVATPLKLPPRHSFNRTVNVRTTVPVKTPTYINVQRLLDLAKPRQWVRLHQPVPSRRDRLVTKTITLKLPTPGSAGRVIIGKRGVSVAPVASYVRRISGTTPPVQLGSSVPVKRLNKKSAHGRIEEHRKRYQEIKVLHGSS